MMKSRILNEKAERLRKRQILTRWYSRMLLKEDLRDLRGHEEYNRSLLSKGLVSLMMNVRNNARKAHAVSFHHMSLQVRVFKGLARNILEQAEAEDAPFENQSDLAPYTREQRPVISNPIAGSSGSDLSPPLTEELTFNKETFETRAVVEEPPTTLMAFCKQILSDNYSDSGAESGLLSGTPSLTDCVEYRRSKSESRLSPLS